MCPPAVSAQSAIAGSAMHACVIDQQPALVEPVGEHAAPGAEQQQRQELQAGGDADRRAAAGELHDQPHLGDDLHPVARDRDDLAGEVAPVVRDAQRGERAVERRRHSSMPSSSAAARSSVARSAGGERVEPLGEEGVLARAGGRRAARAPAGVIVISAERRSPGSARARDEPDVLEPHDEPGDGRALDALARRRARTASAGRGARPSRAPRSARARGRCRPPGAGGAPCAPPRGGGGSASSGRSEVVRIAN